jgi:hypothetical protein
VRQSLPCGRESDSAAHDVGGGESRQHLRSLVPKEVRPGEAYLFQDEEMACHVENLQFTHQPFGLRMKSSVHVHMQP